MKKKEIKLKAIIFDRDGTLNKSKNQDTHGYILNINEMELLPHTQKALELANKKDLKCFVFTQQRGINKRLLNSFMLDNIHDKMSELLGENAKIEKYYYCPHKSNEKCKCSKPKPGMILDILHDYNLKPAEVLVMGDAFRDYESAKAAKTNFVFIKSPKHTDDYYKKTGIKTYNNILEAINDINF